MVTGAGWASFRGADRATARRAGFRYELQTRNEEPLVFPGGNRGAPDDEGQRVSRAGGEPFGRGIRRVLRGVFPGVAEPRPLRAGAVDGAGAVNRDADIMGRWSTRLAWAQGAFYGASGLWPVVDLRSFYAVTGPKTDGWLVQTVGLLLAVFGVVLMRAAWRRRLTPEWRWLAVGFALALAAVDVVFVARNVVPPIYLADAAAELLIVGAWFVAAGLDRRERGSSASPPPGVHSR